MEFLAFLVRQSMPDHMSGGQHDKPDKEPSPSQNQGTAPEHGMGNSGGHAMSPFLFTRSTEFFVLFKGAFINSTGGFVGALILSFVFAVIATVVSQIIRLHENIALANGGVPSRIIASVLHGFRQFLHYTAMLIVMTMNVWLIIAVVIGHAVGWFIYSLALHNRFKNRVAKDSPDLKATNVACDC